VNAGGSLGQFVFAPLNQVLIASVGWMAGMWTMAVAALATIPIAGPLLTRRQPDTARTAGPAQSALTLREQLRIAARDRSYWCLHAGFFTCGFHISFLVTHLPGEVKLCSLPASVAAGSLAIIGLRWGWMMSSTVLVETVFDSLNSKAALFAVEKIFDETGKRLPVMLSFTITDLSGRTLSGQTVEAYWNSVAQYPILSIGINCALGPREMRPFIEELAGLASIYVSAHPNAGLPNQFGEYDETPEHMGADIHDFLESGFVNIVGGCCGTTPEHISHIAQHVKKIQPRPLPVIETQLV
jgi:hypothetical protein